MKKLQVFSVLVMILAMVVIGCQNGTQEVEGDVGNYTVAKASAVDAGSIKLIKGTNASLGKLVVNFKPAADATQYTYFVSLDKKVIERTNGTSFELGYSKDANGDTISPTAAPDYDLASAIVSVPSTVTGVKYYVGIRAQNSLGNTSKISWSTDPLAAY